MIAVRDKVRFVETDMMGVVHHSNYFRWFEMGRVEYMRQAGVYLLELIDKGILFPITEVSCKYKASAKFDDWVVIETRMVELSRAIIRYNYRVVREEDGLLLAEGMTQNVFTGAKGTIMRLPLDIFKQLHDLFLLEAKEDI